MRQQIATTKVANRYVRTPVAPQEVQPIEVHTLAGAFEMLGAALPYDRNSEIYGEDEPAEYFYQVVAGAVRTYKLLEDGRRQIGAFSLPGDVFGLEAGEAHGFTAEAVMASTVRVAKRGGIIGLAARDSAIAAELWAATARSLRSAQEHMLLLGRRNAEERVATFLLDMARRESSDLTIDLPMSRQDIADFLGLTIETVSRTLTQLQHKAAIELPSARKVLVRCRASLQRLNA
jgi:CRP/FNR family transcriptional regulator, nitrogen fixation regulation protein